MLRLLKNILAVGLIVAVCGCDKGGDKPGNEGLAVPKPSVPDSAFLERGGMGKPVALAAQLNVPFDGSNPRVPESNGPLIALFVQKGILTIEPATDGGSWWRYSYSSGTLADERLNVVVGQRKIIGRSNQRRWTEASIDYFAETITYVIEINEQFKAIAGSRVGPFNLRLVLANDPRQGEWALESYDNLGSVASPPRDERTLLAQAFLAAGRQAMPELKSRVEQARRTAFDMVEKQLAESGSLARDPAHSEVLISRRNKTAYLRTYRPFGQTTISQLISYCDGIRVDGYGRWRVPSIRDLEVVTRTLQTQDAATIAGMGGRLMDAPDGRLWGQIAAPIGTKNPSTWASLITSDAFGFSIYALPQSAYAPTFRGFMIYDTGMLDLNNGGAHPSTGTLTSTEMLNTPVQFGAEGRVICTTRLAA